MVMQSNFVLHPFFVQKNGFETIWRKHNLNKKMEHKSDENLQE